MNTSNHNKSKLQNFIFILVCVGLGSILALALAEGILRVFPGSLPEGVQLRIHWNELGREGVRSIPHPYIGFLYPPNSSGSFERGDFKFKFNTDDYGFRNKGPWPDRADIVIIGDSMAFGYGVNYEQSWAAIVNKGLLEHTITNLGLIGAAPQQYKRVYESFGVKLRPKLLIVGLFPDNDLQDAEKFDKWLKLGAKGNYDSFRLFGKEDYKKSLGVREIIKKTYIYSLVHEAYNSYKGNLLFQGKTITFSDGSRVQLVPDRLEKQRHLMHPGKLGFDITINTIMNLKKHSSNIATKLLVLIFPSKEITYMHAISKSTEDIFLPLKVVLETLNIDYLDLTPFFQEYAVKGEKLFFEVDGHPNQKGYEIVANTLMAHIQKKGNTYGLSN